MSYSLSINTDLMLLAERADPSSNQFATVQGGLIQLLSGWMANTEDTHSSTTLTGLDLTVRQGQAKE